jgi:Domain of unknown function (DUF5076)
MHQLLIPPAATRDANSIQVVSAWIADEGLHCTLNIGFFSEQGHNEPKAWGIVLADMVRHIANALHEDHHKETSKTISEIVDALHEELNSPTSKAEGEFHARPS